MGKHILQLSFPDTANEGVFLVTDISIYDSLTTSISSAGGIQGQVPCTNLQITSPGFSTPTILNVISGFSLVLNACTLGIITSTGCSDSCPQLPDGMYNVRYSIAPTDKVFVEYKIMRITNALNRYYKMLCDLELKPCLPDEDTQQQLGYLDIIFNFLQSAKATVEITHQYSEGMDQYRYAISLMDKMSFTPKRC